MTRILVTGAGGQLGTELVQTFSRNGFQVTGLSREQLDITNHPLLSNFLDQNKFDLLLNASAFTNLDEAELGNPRNFEVNAKAPEYLAKIAIRQNVKLIHFSTDAVFSSEDPEFFYPTSNYCPINAYGRAKVEGEKKILELAADRVTIIRTSWLFGSFGGKFYNNIRNLASKKKRIQVVEDQFGQPTSTQDLANFTSKLISGGAPNGIWHFASPRHASRLDFAQKIYELSGLDSKLIEPTITRRSAQLAPRAKYSLLHIDKSLDGSNLDAPDWEVALKAIISL